MQSSTVNKQSHNRPQKARAGLAVARLCFGRYMPNEILVFKCHFEKILNGMN